MRKLLFVMMALVLTLSLVLPAAAEGESLDGGIVILYTNDIHTHIDGELSYADAAGMKAYYEEQGCSVLLVDAGDQVQGTAFGSMDKGKTIVDLMNAAGYDVATLGNHEFDYGMDGCMNVIEWAQFPYVSCNFYHEKDGVPGESVLDSYRVFDLNGTKVAFIGITTPESFTKTTPAYFQNEKGGYIYGIGGGEDGQILYDAVQAVIDEVSEQADIVIALGHLGDDLSSDPWNSEDVIANTTGLDAFIDGHSHSTVEMKLVKDESGNEVVLTQTGEYFNAIGRMVISSDGTITTGLITENEHEDETVKALEAQWMEEINGQLGQVIGYTDNILDNYDGEGNRLVRRQSTNTGNFASDALYYLFDSMGLEVDVAVMNGGGIRNEAVTGELSYLSCKNIHTFGNVACLIEVTGQQLLDALEWCSSPLTSDGTAESGSLLHPSGMTYEIHTDIPFTGSFDDKDVWTGGPTGEYRVQNVQILNRDTGEYEPLDLNATYRLAGYNYTLRDLGGGCAMFEGCVNVIDYVMEDYLVLATYIQSFPVDEATGLHMVTGYAETDHRIVTVSDSAPLTRLEAVTMLYELMGSPAVTSASPFADAGDAAVIWAYEEGIVNGTSATTFTPDRAAKRQELAAILYRMAVAAGEDVSVGESTNILSYEDAFSISEYAIPAMQWACGAGILSDEEGWILPGDTLTGSEAETIWGLYNRKIRQ